MDNRESLLIDVFSPPPFAAHSQRELISRPECDTIPSEEEICMAWISKEVVILAKLGPEYAFNFISADLAQYLGLVRFYAPNEPLSALEVQMSVIGEVALDVSIRDLHLCLLFKVCQGKLDLAIFGEPFFKEFDEYGFNQPHTRLHALLEGETGMKMICVPSRIDEMKALDEGDPLWITCMANYMIGCTRPRCFCKLKATPVKLNPSKEESDDNSPQNSPGSDADSVSISSLEVNVGSPIPTDYGLEFAAFEKTCSSEISCEHEKFKPVFQEVENLNVKNLESYLEEPPRTSVDSELEIIFGIPIENGQESSSSSPTLFGTFP